MKTMLPSPELLRFPERQIHSRCHRPLLSAAGQRRVAKWILDCDVKSCFDEISQWLVRYIPMALPPLQNGGSRPTRKRLASHRVGCEGRIAHLKREYGGGRSRLKGEDGARIWASWTGLAYNLDTVSRLPVKPSL